VYLSEYGRDKFRKTWYFDLEQLLVATIPKDFVNLVATLANRTCTGYDNHSRLLENKVLFECTDTDRNNASRVITRALSSLQFNIHETIWKQRCEEKLAKYPELQWDRKAAATGRNPRKRNREQENDDEIRHTDPGYVAYTSGSNYNVE
jgi:hypothetical protein